MQQRLLQQLGSLVGLRDVARAQQDIGALLERVEVPARELVELLGLVLEALRRGWDLDRLPHRAVIHRAHAPRRERTALRGDEHRAGKPRDEAARALDRYGLAKASEQTFDSLSGGQQARFQILLLELSGATCLLLDEPTDNLDLHSAEALEEGLAAFEGTVLAVTHDRWFSRGFERYLVFGADGRVYESDEPVWDEGRVERAR